MVDFLWCWCVYERNKIPYESLPNLPRNSADSIDQCMYAQAKNLVAFEDFASPDLWPVTNTRQQDVIVDSCFPSSLRANEYYETDLVHCDRIQQHEEDS